MSLNSIICGEIYFSFKCEKCGNITRHYITCKRRTCLRCAKVRSKQLVEMYLPVVKSFQWACFITLTLKVGINVKDSVNKIMKSFNKLRHRKIWNVKKGIYALEIVKKERGWYVHIHAFVDSKWMEQSELSKEWYDITGNSYIVDIRRIKGNREGGLREVLKYQTKIWELGEEDKEFVEEVFKHRRFINSIGIKRPKKPEFKGMICKRWLFSGKRCGGRLVLCEDWFDSS